MAMAAAAVIGRRRGFSSNLYSHKDEDDEGPNKCWIFLLFCAGSTLLFTGLWYAYISFDDARLQAIKPYNDAIMAWEDTYRKNLVESSFQWRLLSPQEKKVTVPCSDTQPSNCTKVETQYVDVEASSAEAAAIPWKDMQIDTTPDPLAADQSMKGIKNYTALKLVALGMLPKTIQGHIDHATGQWVGNKFKLQVKSVHQGMTSVIDIEPFDIMKYVAVGANAKMCRVHYGGLMINGQCYERVAIAGVCMTIQDTSAGWQPPSAGRCGCFGSGMEVLFGKSCPGSHAHLTSDDPTCDFSLANMTLRSLHDPHQVALSLTSGTLNFGLTPHENWVQGMVMLVIGCVLLLPVIPSCCLYIHSKRSSYDRRMRDDDFLERLRANRYSPSARSANYLVVDGRPEGGEGAHVINMPSVDVEVRTRWRPRLSHRVAGEPEEPRTSESEGHDACGRDGGGGPA
uniref:Uncharacterized protein n=1 Tax=Guillardia theta TaxID=55529 RepID=A0A7S4P7B8_GUITH|mmetsp:Transcript_44583/g.140722  ORF Transcript_44583/g.140722 Transcript_44583/m.140722 type:complete len:455 (+) Transcript_44583:228-1592(+)